MTSDAVLRILEDVASGAVSAPDGLARLAWLPTEDVNGMARLDHHRALRIGFPEVVFCAGKTPAQSVAICERMAAKDGGFLATRADAATMDALGAAFPDAAVNRLGRIVWLRSAAPERVDAPPALIVCAGTSDLPVAEEAAVTLEAFGHDVARLTDVGVAGIHRILENTHRFDGAGVVIVIAGMEGALPSVIGGLTGLPVIAVPTSVGYGAAFGGVAALLGMLNSCASGITVVNIDNGFGAACAATRMLRQMAKRT